MRFLARIPRWAIVIAALISGVGGVAWAATQATSSNVITACANDARALFLSTNGSCPSGQTLVQWDKQGPQGPAGATPTPVLVRAPSSYHGGFTIKGEIDNPGDYFIDGSADLNLVAVPKDNHFRTFTVFCNLYTGPVNGSATRLSRWTIVVHRHAGPSYVPSTVTGPVDVNGDVNLTQDKTPLQIILTCRGGPDSVWTHPAITYELASGPAVFHPRVGSALPNKPHIGPGQIGRVFGG